MVRQVRERGLLTDYEIDILTKSGEIRTVLTSIKVYIEEGYLEGSTVDITERRQAELALRESEERYRALAEAAPDMVFVIDREDRVQYLNDFAARQFRVNAEEVIGKPRALLFPGAAGEQRVKQLREVLETGSPHQSEGSVSFAAGERWLSTWLVPMRDQDGQVTAVMGVSRDITERKLAEEQLRAFSQDLERSNKELEQFAYVASHDLQEPLRVVTGYLQLIERRYKDRIDADANDFIHFAVDGVARMQQLISDLLDYCRVGTQGKSFAPTNLEAVLDKALVNLQAVIGDSGAVVTRDPLPTVEADQLQWIRLLQNLIGNGIKFRGERRPEIHVSAREEAGHWVFSVRDNGIGIEPQYWEKVFVIFQRLHTRQKYSGTGIGLAICKRIVQRHGGRIWLESQPGQGTTFYWTI
jgi:PAS domain S-box-containing protein